ncbi:transglutaminase-like domain-containing protein [Stieleria sp. JC731]|uniref:transglutaminase-like domain-containing protein n=1 Tax=Pirellulaceae TaxID=2691357 RepID=UPI001E5F0D00|nr:transglutaminase-like domain-containing protein [Stieleria sp. JC731]MCC9602351.1 transglutaminase-like domain-containing protein [Stieleria sp. JC731]
MFQKSRKQIETITLAFVPLVAVAQIRFGAENRWLLGIEFTTIVIATSLGLVGSPRIRWAGRGALPFIPIAAGVIARWLGHATAFELSALTAFATTALALGCNSLSTKLRSLSLVISGFSVLFASSISDHPLAIGFPITWLLICVWHLIANRWERLELAQAESVVPTQTSRLVTRVLSVILLLSAFYMVKDHTWQSKPLSSGFMPTSGGSKWSDPAARNGVGTGDAAIAAKDHASSFGAVDTNVFIESKESSLFDMFNDMVGEPQTKTKYEQRQALANQSLIPSHQRTARSEKGSQSFSTDRLPPTQHHEFGDTVSDSVLQWEGATGIRLAMHRYDLFDGITWRCSEETDSKHLIERKIDDNHWFFDRTFEGWITDQSASVGLLKVLRLDSDRIPSPMLTAGVHIKDVDRIDFFDIGSDDCFFMPGRDKLPPLTVFHLASFTATEDEIRAGLSYHYPTNGTVPGVLQDFVSTVAQPHSDNYDKLSAIVEHLRTQFRFDREASQEDGIPVEQFMKSGRGGDHLFATATALAARQLGLKSRLVTGFYVRPNAFDFSAGHSNIHPLDVHIWAEVRLDDGRWIEIESTPGYAPPIYKPSWWLQAKRYAAANWPYAATTLGLSLAFWIFRFRFIDLALFLVWKSSFWRSTKTRIRLATIVIESRAKHLGHKRPKGQTQRQWIDTLTQSADESVRITAIQFCETADSIYFGFGEVDYAESAAGLVRLLDRRTLWKTLQQPSL